MEGSSCLEVAVESFSRWISRGSIVAILNKQGGGRSQHQKSRFNVYPSERIEADENGWDDNTREGRAEPSGKATLSRQHRGNWMEDKTNRASTTNMVLDGYGQVVIQAT